MVEFFNASHPLASPGQMRVAYENRVDFGRLRDYRLERATRALELSERGAFLLFDFYNIRCATSSQVGGALGDKMIGYAFLTRGGEPHLWDFGLAVKYHQLYSPWLTQDHSHPGFLGFCGAVSTRAGLIVEALKPGVRENEIVALAEKKLYEYGSGQVKAINAISGESCNPRPHNFTDRIIRPGDQAFFDIVHLFNGCRTCYHRTFSVGRATSPQRAAYSQPANGRITPSLRSGLASVRTRSRVSSRRPNRLGLKTNSRPLGSNSAARTEEELVITDDGSVVITKYPAEELVVTNPY
jgi:hypothetical protein